MPADPAEQAEALLDRAEVALDEGNTTEALDLCARAQTHVAGHPGAHFVRGDAYRMEGRYEEACDEYRAAALGRPDHAASWAAYALTSFEILRWDEARTATDRAIREDPRNPEGWWVRALLLERTGDFAGRDRALTHARFLDPANFALPPRLTDEEVEQIVEDAVGALHPRIRDYLANVAILLEDVPTEDDLMRYDPPMSPIEILGYFSGHSVGERSMNDAWSQLPGTIVLFRSNLERLATDRAELVEQLRITVYHEVGHFLGLSEEDLEDRGLD